MVLLVSYYGPFGELLWSFWSVTMVLLVSLTMVLLVSVTMVLLVSVIIDGPFGELLWSFW